MSFTSWPLGIPSSITDSKFKYVNMIISSSPMDKGYIDSVSTTSTSFISKFIPKLDSNSDYITSSIIPLDSISFASENIIKLENDDFAKSALPENVYSSFVGDLFNQFGLASTIITSMLAYGNTDNLSVNGNDIVTQWPNGEPTSSIVSVIDAMTKSVTNITGNTIPESNFYKVSEWRWMRPNLSTRIEPSTSTIVSMLDPNTAISNSISYPNRKNKWGILRYDFYEDKVFSTYDDRNTLKDIENDSVKIVYDNIAAPGCILFVMKTGCIYDDRSGSFNSDTNENTSRSEIESTYTINDIVYPVVFRVGLEFISEFITLAGFIFTDGVSILENGGDIRDVLTEIKHSYIGCKRLYMWKIVYDVITYRIQDFQTYVGPLTGYSKPGIYMCLLSGNTDYSSISTAVDLEQPKWSNFWNPTSQYTKSDTTLACLTSTEILAYMTSKINPSDQITPDKYSDIRIIVVDVSTVPNLKVVLEDINFENSKINTLDSNICFLDTENCWEKFDNNSTNTNTTNTTNNINIGKIIFFIILGILVFFTVLGLIWYGIAKKNRDHLDPSNTVLIPIPKSNTQNNINFK